MGSDFVAVGNGFRDEIFPNLHRVWQIVAQRQRRANGGGIRATGAVRGNALHKLRRQQQFIFTIVKNIYGYEGILEVAAFQ